MKTYVAVCHRVGNWWAIDVPAVKGVHTQSKRLEQAEAMARDAIALLLDADPDSFEVEVRWELPSYVTDLLESLSKSRQEAVQAKRDAAMWAIQTAQALVKDVGLSVRDAGTVMGVSHQRVDQLLHAA
jgi:predicted RNase H-like HicB family nuclease